MMKRQRENAAVRADWMRGMYMNEAVVWYSSQRADEEQARLITGVFDELGLQTAKSEDPGDLRLLLTGVEPLLMLAELNNISEWAGWGIISEMREQGMFFPVMVVAAGREERVIVEAFENGGNEYMSSPLHRGEFKCRVRNLLMLTGRRRGLDSLLKVDGLLLDPARRLVSRDEIPLTLTPKEFDLLYYLAANLGHACPREEILKHVWGYHFHADTNVVDVYIRHIRLKVDKGYRHKLIHTVRGTGYVMRAPQGGPAL
ncbi:DNA-binding response regulator [Paenibacillus sp. PK3_47]|uniref:winged helix-turn-helix domain-containing protein n=1 Tax=Paenibacillus sp. PK3_47 TaxID=2072642 RepID=UPI00201E482A|nr:response regulator transcription factor [Paenibacillus sp. PK3_47]UQZ37146.1 DNA-binding response regulator [Paenibacillus sp. PK3_47]